MLALSEKFLTENARDRNTPALLVDILSHNLFNEQTTQADWEANSGESNVDYTASPGDVVLAPAPVPNEEQTGHNDSAFVYSTTGLQGPFYHEAWQSFKQHTSTAKVLALVTVKITTAGGNGSLKCEIWSAGKGGKIGSTASLSIPYNVSNYDMTFDFAAQGLILNSNTEYWLKFYVTGTMDGTSLPGCSVRYNTSTSSYADGQFDHLDHWGTWTYNMGDLYFQVTMTGEYYQPSGYIRTQNMDLGEVPPGTGEWVLENIEPPATSIVYQAWASDTGAFAGEEVNLDTIQDGDPITVLRRYYRVRADLSTSDASFSPALQSVKANFEVYDTYSDNISLGYEPAVLSVSALTTTIDVFEKSTISQVDLAIGLTEGVSKWLKTGYPRNKLVKVRAGFVAPGWTQADYENYFWGQVEDWRIEPDYAVKLQVQDYAKAWKASVPEKWESALDDVAWANMHPVDVCLDILRNHINVRDSKLVLGSFEAVKGALSGWKVSRTVTGDTVDADELLQELRILMGCYFIPQADGRIRIKRWDPNEAAVDSLTDDDMANVRWEANSASLINQTHIYYGWDNDGDKAQDFTELRVAPDATSQANWNELRIKEIKDKWTRPSETSQVQDLESKVLARFANPPSVLSCEVARSRIYLEVGDIVTVTTKKAPSTDMGGISNARYQIINRNLDFKRDAIRLKLLAVSGGY